MQFALYVQTLSRGYKIRKVRYLAAYPKGSRLGMFYGYN